MRMRKRKLVKFVGCVALLVLALVTPLITQSDYLVRSLILSYLFSILTLGFALVWATGRLTLGQAGFFAIGAYFSTVVVTRLGVSFWLALPLSGIVASIFGLMIGLAILRRGGITFLMLTWASAEVIRLVIGNEQQVLGGRIGLVGIPAPNPISVFGLGIIDFTVSNIPYYYLVLLLLLVTLLFLWRLYNSRFGRIFHSLSQNDLLSRSVGVDIAGYRLLAFSIAAFFAGLAGSFYAHYMSYLDPDYFTLMTSVTIQVYAVVGGIFNFISGPLVGTILLSLLVQYLRGWIIYEAIIYGVILIIVGLFLPRGLISLPRLLLQKAGVKRRWITKGMKL